MEQSKKGNKNTEFVVGRSLDIFFGWLETANHAFIDRSVVLCGALSVAVEITLFSRFSFTAIIIGFRLESFSLSFSIDFSSCFYNCFLLMIFCASFSFCWMFLCSRALWASIYINIDQALRQCDSMHKRKLIFSHKCWVFDFSKCFAGTRESSLNVFTIICR